MTHAITPTAASGRSIKKAPITSSSKASSPTTTRTSTNFSLANSANSLSTKPKTSVSNCLIRRFRHYSFQQLRIHPLFAPPFSSNVASHRALEKAGFQREGLLRHHHLKQGTYLDAIIYARISHSNGNA